MRTLLVGRGRDLAEAIAPRMRTAGFAVDIVGSAEEALHAATIAPYGLALVECLLPDGTGVDLIPDLRRIRSGLPVILVSAEDIVSERIRGLDAGADDYLVRPFSLDELMARIRAVLRRPVRGSPVISLGALTVDPASGQAMVNGSPLVLRRRELSLLAALVRRAGRVVGRDTLLGELYGFGDEVQSNTLDAHVSRLRTRLGRAGAGVVIRPVRGVGYVLDRG